LYFLRGKLHLKINFHKNSHYSLMLAELFHTLCFFPTRFNERESFLRELKCDTCRCEWRRQKAPHKTAKPRKNINYALQL
jgi:hypothetical protein